MTSEAINYIHKRFTYAISRDRGNSNLMAAAIKNIPYYVFNQHSNCGGWCDYVKNKENYEHSSLMGGLKSTILFDELR